MRFVVLVEASRECGHLACVVSETLTRMGVKLMLWSTRGWDAARSDFEVRSLGDSRSWGDRGLDRNPLIELIYEVNLKRAESTVVKGL